MYDLHESRIRRLTDKCQITEPIISAAPPPCFYYDSTKVTPVPVRIITTVTINKYNNNTKRVV